MYIDGVRVVNNNLYQGINATAPQVTGVVTLGAGQHEILVGFYQGTGGFGALAFYNPPAGVTNSGTNTLIPVNDGAGGTGGNQILTGSQVSAAATALTNVTNPADATGNVTLAANATGTIAVTGVLNTTFNNLSLTNSGSGGSTLNLQGTAARFAQTTFTGGGTFNLGSTSAAAASGAGTAASPFVITTAGSANDQSIALGRLVGDANAVTISKTGPYNVVLDQTTNANTLAAGSSVNVQGGGLSLVGTNGGNNPLGTGIGVTLNTAAPASNGITSALYLASQSGAVTFDNPVTVSDNAAVQAGGALVFPNGGTQAAGVTVSLGSATNGVSIASGKTLTASSANTNTLAFAGALTGAGTLAVSAGTVNLTVANPAFTGPITVNGGQLLAGADCALGTTAGATTVNSGGQLSIRANYATAEPVTLNGTGTSANGALEESGGNFSLRRARHPRQRLLRRRLRHRSDAHRHRRHQHQRPPGPVRRQRQRHRQHGRHHRDRKGALHPRRHRHHQRREQLHRVHHRQLRHLYPGDRRQPERD